MKLNKVAKKWVKALRSGRFKQAHGQLGTDDGKRCCLGVLCELAVEAKVIKEFDIGQVFLPEEVRDWAGLASERGNYSTGALWADNDGKTDSGRTLPKKRFKTIAKIIESQPEGLFKAVRDAD